jgi:hypothetical protein
MNQKRLRYNDSFDYKNLFKDDDLSNVSAYLNVPGVQGEDKMDFPNNINLDTYLRYPSQFCRDKENDGKLTCDNIIITNLPRQRNLNTGCYWNTPIKSQGRGLGNLDTRNNLWFSENTRNVYADNVATYDYNRFHNTHRNYQDPYHLVMTIPRGGFDTRHLQKKSIKNN